MLNHYQMGAPPNLLLIFVLETNESLILLGISMTEVEGIFLCEKVADIKRAVLFMDLYRLTVGESGL